HHDTNLHLHSFPTRRSSDLSRVHARCGIAGKDKRSHEKGADRVCSSSLRLGFSGSCPNLLESATSELVLLFKLVDGTFNGNGVGDRKSTRLNSSHLGISYAV